MKTKFEIREECQLLYAWMRHTEYYSALVKQRSQKKQFKYLIDTMELYHFTDEQWNNLKAILTDNKEGFTDG